MYLNNILNTSLIYKPHYPSNIGAFVISIINSVKESIIACLSFIFTSLQQCGKVYKIPILILKLQLFTSLKIIVMYQFSNFAIDSTSGSVIYWPTEIFFSFAMNEIETEVIYFCGVNSVHTRFPVDCKVNFVLLSKPNSNV